MIETVLNVTAIQPIEAEVFGVTLSRRGNRGHGWAVQNLYRCDGRRRLDRRHRAHRRAVASAGRRAGPAVVDRRSPVRHRGRATNHADEIDLRLQGWFAGQKLDDAVNTLAAVGVPAAPVVSPSLVTENVQLNHRGFLETLDHPRTGPGRYPTSAVRAAGWTAHLADAPAADTRSNTTARCCATCAASPTKNWRAWRPPG